MGDVIDNSMIEDSVDGRRHIVTATSRSPTPSGVNGDVRIIYTSVANDMMAVRNSKKAQKVEPDKNSAEQQPVRDGFPLNHRNPNVESTLIDAEVNLQLSQI
jgi:hypothetical protein